MWGSMDEEVKTTYGKNYFDQKVKTGRRTSIYTNTQINSTHISEKLLSPKGKYREEDKYTNIQMYK